MTCRFGRLLLVLLLAVMQAPAQQDQKVPDMSFEVGMSTEGVPGVYHYLRFSSVGGNGELIEITISELLFNVEKCSTREGTIQVSKGFARDEYVIKYLSPTNPAKFFKFTFDSDHYLKSITGSATSIEKMPGQEECKVSVDSYVEMKNEERHYIPVTRKTILPGMYPRNTKLTKQKTDGRLTSDKELMVRHRSDLAGVHRTGRAGQRSLFSSCFTRQRSSKISRIC